LGRTEDSLPLFRKNLPHSCSAIRDPQSAFLPIRISPYFDER
jgi:hypothetical protein